MQEQTISDRNVALIERFYECYASGDLETMRNEVLAPDVRWTIPGHHPMSGTKQGAEEIVAYFRQLQTADFKAETLIMGANDDYVIDCHRGWGRHGDQELDILWCLLYRIRDGRIAEVVNFAADQHAADAFFWAAWQLKPIPDRLEGRRCRLALGVALAAMVMVLPVACGGGPREASVPAAATAPTTAPPGATLPQRIPSTPAAQVIRRHLDAVARGDLTTYLTTVAEDARFDIGGRILSGREEIRGFAESDLFDPDGRYEILSLTPTPEGAVLDLDFLRGSLHERLNYRYAVRDGQIRELVARYRQPTTST